MKKNQRVEKDVVRFGVRVTIEFGFDFEGHSLITRISICVGVLEGNSFLFIEGDRAYIDECRCLPPSLLRDTLSSKVCR